MSFGVAEKKFFRMIEVVHLRFFGHPMSGEMRKFLGYLSWSFFGGIIASLVMLFVNVVGGRFMGPEQYGLYGLVLAVSQILILLALFGMDTAGLQLLSKDETGEARSESMTTIAVFVGFSTTAVIVFFLMIAPFISNRSHVDLIFFLVAATYSVIVIARSVSDVFFRGLSFFREQFFSRMAEVFLIICLFFVAFFFLKKVSYVSYFFVLCGGYIGFILCGVWFFRRYFSKFRFNILKKGLSYAWIIILSSALGIVFSSLDKFIIVKYLSIQELGVYMAYFTASTNLVAQATQIFVNVYFPFISKVSDKDFVRKLDRLFLFGAVPVFFVLSSIIYIVMLLFGSRYGYDMRYIASFGLLATAQIILTVYWSTIMALSKKLYKKYVLISNIINFTHIAGYGLLIFFGNVSILAIVYMFIANTAVSIFVERWLLARMSIFDSERKVLV